MERERITLELEEEKKAQAEREKRLQEQAKKIENLSSMVLCSNRVEGRDTYKKVSWSIIYLYIALLTFESLLEALLFKSDFNKLVVLHSVKLTSPIQF